MLHLLTPHLFVESVLDLDPRRLSALEIDALLLDVDCTLKRYREEQVAADVRHWIEQLRSAGIGLCLVSNGRRRRIARLAESLQLTFVAMAFKPLPRACRRAVREGGFRRDRTAMVGDQVFADVVAARLAGLTAILVRPIHPEDEPWPTRLKRPLERFVLRRVLPAESSDGKRGAPS